MALETEELNVVKCSKKDFDNQRVKPDNYLFFVYDERVVDGKPKTRIRLYKGNVLVSGDVTIIQGDGGDVNVGALEAGKAYFLEPFEEPVINIRDGKYIDVGIPRAPFVLTEETVLQDIDITNTGHSSIGVAVVDGIDDTIVNDSNILLVKNVYKNPSDYPCFVIAHTFPSNGDTEKYSSSDNVLLIPPHGKGIVTHSKTYPGNTPGVSTVYPKMKMMPPKVVYEVIFQGTDTAIYDNINNIETSISGKNLNYNPEEGLSDEHGFQVVIEEAKPREEMRPGVSDAYFEMGCELDAVLYQYGYHFIVHLIGYNAGEDEEVRVVLMNGSSHVITRNRGGKIIVSSPYRSYNTDNLDLAPLNYGYNNFEEIYSGIRYIIFNLEPRKPLKGIRIIAGTPDDILRSPEFLEYKFD